MSRLNFITGVALFVVAATLAVTITVSRPEVSAADNSPPPSERMVGRAPGIPAKASAVRGDARRQPVVEVFSVMVPEDHPQHGELAEAVVEVEAEARHRLERLTRQLQLSREQRRIIFPILARTVPSYDPVMQVSGVDAGAPSLTETAGEKQVQSALEPEQKDRMIEESVAELALWKEIVEQLQKELEQETPNLPETGDPGTGPAHRRRNLRDVMEQNR